MKYKPICAVLTPDEGIRYFPSHDPVLALNGAPIAINLSIKNGGGGTDQVQLRLCQRCGVAYVEQHAKTFQQEAALKTPIEPETQH